MAKRAEAKPHPESRVIDAALALAARQGWRRTSLADIAAEAALPLHEVYGTFRSKPAILAGFGRRIDAAALAGAEDNAREPRRDRLFDTLMRRFDALLPHKAAVRALLAEAPGDPAAALCGAPALLRSMAWMLEASGIASAGLCGRARTALLAALYLSVLRVWLEDDSADMTRTMSALDQRLRRAQPWLGLGSEAPRPRADAAPEPPAA